MERAHGTHQDRLVKKLRLAGIRSYEAANCFLEDGYLADHNRRFARVALSEADFHRKRPSKRELDAAFHLEQERVLSLDWVISYNGRLLQLQRQSRHHAPARSKVLVRENQAGELHVEYRGRRLTFTEIPQRTPRERSPCFVRPASRAHKTPSNNHPWRQAFKTMQASLPRSLPTTNQGTFLLWYDIFAIDG